MEVLALVSPAPVELAAAEEAADAEAATPQHSEVVNANHSARMGRPILMFFDLICRVEAMSSVGFRRWSSQAPSRQRTVSLTTRADRT